MSAARCDDVAAAVAAWIARRRGVHRDHLDAPNSLRLGCEVRCPCVCLLVACGADATGKRPGRPVFTQSKLADSLVAWVAGSIT